MGAGPGRLHHGSRGIMPSSEVLKQSVLKQGECGLGLQRPAAVSAALPDLACLKACLSATL